jgi:hypothetical protein
MATKKVTKKYECERIERIQTELNKISPSPEVIQRAHEISRELSKISVEKLYKPFDV